MINPIFSFRKVILLLKTHFILLFYQILSILNPFFVMMISHLSIVFPFINNESSFSRILLLFLSISVLFLLNQLSKRKFHQSFFSIIVFTHFSFATNLKQYFLFLSFRTNHVRTAAILFVLTLISHLYYHLKFLKIYLILRLLIICQLVVTQYFSNCFSQSTIIDLFQVTFYLYFYLLQPINQKNELIKLQYFEFECFDSVLCFRILIVSFWKSSVAILRHSFILQFFVTIPIVNL